MKSKASFRPKEKNYLLLIDQYKISSPAEASCVINICSSQVHH